MNNIIENKFKRLREAKSAVILSIETSCDETAAAVVKDGRKVLSNVVFTQIDLHKIYGGVVPEIASRAHVEKIGWVVDEALKNAGMQLDDIDAIAVTAGPGLIGALLVGVSYAKGLAFATNKPLVGINHIMGHISANFIAFEKLEPPFMCIVASGGHSHIAAAEDYCKYQLIGATRDDAAGEAFDKAARALGLPYPGGPELEKLAATGDENAYKFPRGFNAGDHYDFSFSGLKTSIVNIIHNAKQKDEPINKADLAASFQKELIEVIALKAVKAAKEKCYDKLVLAGGVAANIKLRSTLKALAEKNSLEFFCPPMGLCTDNAAMIGAAGYFSLMEGKLSDWDLNGTPNLDW